MKNHIDPELIEGLSKLNTGIFNTIVKLNEEARKDIERVKTLKTLVTESFEEETFDKIQKAREGLFDYLTDLSAKAEKALNSYKK